MADPEVVKQNATLIFGTEVTVCTIANPHAFFEAYAQRQTSSDVNDGAEWRLYITPTGGVRTLVARAPVANNQKPTRLNFSALDLPKGNLYELVAYSTNPTSGNKNVTGVLVGYDYSAPNAQATVNGSQTLPANQAEVVLCTLIAQYQAVDFSLDLSNLNGPATFIVYVTPSSGVRVPIWIQDFTGPVGKMYAGRVQNIGAGKYELVGISRTGKVQGPVTADFVGSTPVTITEPTSEQFQADNLLPNGLQYVIGLVDVTIPRTLFFRITYLIRDTVSGAGQTVIQRVSVQGGFSPILIADSNEINQNNMLSPGTVSIDVVGNNLKLGFTNNIANVNPVDVVIDVETKAGPETQAVPVPQQIPGLMWWLRGDRGTHRTAVSQWNDSSGSGDPNRNLTAPINGGTLIDSDPEFGLQTTIRFDAINLAKLWMPGLWSDAPVNQPFTIVIIGKDENVAAHYPWIGDFNINEWYQATFGLPPSFAVPPKFFGSSAPNPVPTDIELNSIIANNGQPVIYVSEFNDPNDSTIRINSIPMQPTVQHGGAGPADTGINPLGQLAIGWSFGTGQPFQGKMAEIIIIDGILSDELRASLIAYASQRYSIAIDGSAVPLNSPLGLPGLRAWWRADLNVEAHVSQWDDISGIDDPNRNVVNNGLIPTQPITIPKDPNYNNQDTISFLQQWLDMVGLWNDAPINQPYTLIVVGNDAAAGVENFLGAKAANQWWLTAESPTGYGSDVNLTLLGTTPDSNTPKILVLEYHDPNSTISVSALTPENTGNTGTGALPALEVGANTQGQRPLNPGVIGEVLAYHRILTSAEKSLLYNYLGLRYGIAVGP